MVGDGHPMCITAEVVENMLRAAEGPLAVDDPVVTEQLPDERGESLRLGQRQDLAVETELAIREGALQGFDKLAPKDATEHLDRKKESIARANPAGVVGREPAGGNDAMDVRMMLQLLIPGMEHTEKADLCPEMFGIASHFEQRFSAGAEQQIVDELLILQCQRRQQMRQREDDVNVARGKEFLTARFDPTVSSVGLALRAVPVSTGVV